MADTMRAKLDLTAAQHMCQFGSIGFGQKFPHPPSDAGWSDFSPTEQSAARHLISAVLDALMEPTEGMFDDLGGTALQWAPGVWQAMIRAAKEGK